jgi:hypothetical protein
MNNSIEEVRAARQEIFEQCDNDLKKLVEYYMQCQEEHPERLIVPQLHTPLFEPPYLVSI